MVKKFKKDIKTKLGIDFISNQGFFTNKVPFMKDPIRGIRK